VFAQAVTSPEFDAASVKVNLTGDGHTSVDQDGGSFRMSNVTLRLCITRAYEVTDPQVSGPGWLDSDKYDIVAKAPAGTPESQLPAMLRSLLADRFKLAVHREQKVVSVYALVVAKNGPKLAKAEPGASGGMTTERGHLRAEAVTMTRLANFLASPRAALALPVVDQTGLDGIFNFTLAWTPESSSAARPEDRLPDAHAPPPIFEALQEQLGLKLEARKAPVDMLVVDHAEKVPTGN
jgi:uncharacterized protein (TIGR03435 family)